MSAQMRSIATGALCLGLVLMAGCGGGSNGSSPPAGPPDSGNAFTLDPLQVGTASGHRCDTLTLNSPGTSRIAFTVLHGSTIVRLREMGYGKIAFSSNRDGDHDIYPMNADGSEGSAPPAPAPREALRRQSTGPSVAQAFGNRPAARRPVSPSPLSTHTHL